MLSTKFVAAAITTFAIVGFGAPAYAAEDVQDPFMLFKMEMIDKNKDGMVSKKEFMAMMDKAYDMKVKAMGAKGGMLTEAQMRDFLKSLYVGG